MSNMQIFNNKEFGEIRMMVVDSKPYAVGSDVAKALEYSIPHKAVRDHCRGVLTWNVPHPQSPEKEMEVLIIPEGDILRLIVKAADQSKNPEIKARAERFERLIFDEILPTINKHGAYLTPAKIEEVLLNPDTIIKLAQNLKSEQEKVRQLSAKVEEDHPKVLFADSVSAASNSILIGELAKLIKQNGRDIGQNRLFEWMRQNGFLISRKGTDFNMPTQRSMEMKLFTIKETTINKPDGSIHISKTVKVTGKGQIYFINIFCGKKAG